MMNTAMRPQPEEIIDFVANKPFTYFIRDEWEENQNTVIEKIESKIPYPMFVKPSNSISSS